MLLTKYRINASQDQKCPWHLIYAMVINQLKKIN